MKKFLAGMVLILSQPVSADWCDGSQYVFIKMPLSERVKQASEALVSAKETLVDEVGRLKLDMHKGASKTQVELNQQYSDLSDQTVKLCEAFVQGDLPIKFQHINFMSAVEVTAQLKLNLRLLEVQKSAYSVVEQQMNKMVALAEMMNEKSAVFSVLLKQVALSNGESKLPYSPSQFVQNACLAIDHSDSLLQEAGVLNMNALLAKNIESLRGEAISKRQWNKLLDTCEVDSLVARDKTDSGWLGNMMQTINYWM